MPTCIVNEISLDLTSGNWVQYDRNPGDPGDWSYDPNTGYITNAKNQNEISGFYNTDHLDYTDYRLILHYRTSSLDDDGIGAIFRFQDNNNWYAVMSDDGGLGFQSHARLMKCENGTINTIAIPLIADAAWTRYIDNVLDISVVGGHITVILNGQKVFDYVDSNPIATGAFGPITKSQPNTTFTSIEAIVADAPQEPEMASFSIELSNLTVNISWNPVIDPATVSREESDYKIKVGTIPGGDDVLATTDLSAGTNSYQVLLPAQGRLYYIGIQAYSICSKLGSTWATKAVITIDSISTIPFTKTGIDTLRQRTNELRNIHGLPDYSWTDPTITKHKTLPKKIHFDELKTAIEDIFNARGELITWNYNITTGDLKNDTHWQELENKLNSLI